MLAAGLLAKKAVERGLTVESGGQGLARARLARRQRLSEQDRPAAVSRPARLQSRRLRLHDVHRQFRPAAPRRSRRRSRRTTWSRPSVLSGNRNFEARVHQNIKANFLMSPPLVVAFALAGRVDIDLSREPLGKGSDGRDVFLRDIWPTLAGSPRPDAVRAQAGGLPQALQRFRRAESEVERNPVPTGDVYEWDAEVHLHPGAAVLRELFDAARRHRRNQRRARARHLWRLRDDRPHLAGRLPSRRRSPAGKYLLEQRRRVRGLQQLRLAPRQRPRDDARHVRQRAHQEPDAPGAEGGVTHASAARRGRR